MPFFAFALTAAFWPGISGAALTTRWAVLALAVPILFPAKVRVTWAHIAVFGLVAWSAYSVSWSPSLPDAMVGLVYLTLIAGCFCIGAASGDNLRGVFVGASIGAALSSAASIAQVFFGWTGVAQFSVPGGLFINPNIMGEAVALILMGAVVHRLWWAIPLIAPAFLLSGSRGAYVAIACGLVAWARSRVVTGAFLILIAVSGIVISTHGHRIESIKERFAIWADTIDGMTLRGNGVGSFYALYPATATRTDTLKSRPKHAHNDFLEIAFEAGAGGLAVLLALGVCALRNRRGNLIPVLVVLGALCLVGFPLHNPASAAFGALVAGHVCGRGARVRLSLAESGVPVRPVGARA